MAEAITLKYRAFLSYAHADTRVAQRVHRRLEAFRIDNDLIGRATAQGPIPNTLRPIFRDRDDFTAGHTLTEQTLAALDASAALLVLCSPRSAKSPYVNEEIRLFKSRHPERPVIPVIADGTPGDAEHECFTPALRFLVSPDGAITNTPDDELAADVRESGDGFDLAVAKVVARLLDLSTDDVFRRAERARRRGARVRNAIIGALAALAVSAAGSAAYAWQQLKTNEAFLDAALKRATDIVNTAVSQAEKYNVPRTATLELLTRAEGLFDDMARLGRPTPLLQQQKAMMLIEFARNYAILGDTTKQRERAEEAQRILETLASDNSQNTTALRELAVAQSARGDVFVAQGNVRAALTSYRASLAIMGRLNASDPGKILWQRDLSVSNTKVGDALVALGNLSDALASYRASLAIDQRLAEAGITDGLGRRVLSISHDRVGDVLAALGDLDGALTSYRAALALREAIAADDPNNVVTQRDLSVSHEHIGDALGASGHFPEALASQQAGLAIRERLAKLDPQNTDWQRDVAVACNKVGDALIGLEKTTEALASYRASLAIRERLAVVDVGNVLWQRDLAASLNKVGGALAIQGNLSDALKSFQLSHNIFERIAKADPDNAGWQRDLAISDERLGGIHQARKEDEDAKAAYEAALAIYTALLTRYPDNTPVRAASTVPLMHLGELNGTAGRSYYVRALEILKSLDEDGHLELRRKPAIGWIEQRLAALPAPP